MRSRSCVDVLPGPNAEKCFGKKTCPQFQSIADEGACRKTPVAAENHHLEAKKVAGADGCCRGPHIDIGDDDLIPVTTNVFNLPERLVAKADPALIAGDEQHLAAVAESLEQQIADLSGRLHAQRRAPGGKGRRAVDWDLEIHRLTANLRMLQRFGLDLCLGRIVSADSDEPVYIGRLGLT